MLEPLREPFMQRALLEVTLIGLASGALGCWVVLYGLSYAAESLAHSIFPGLVAATLAGLPLLAGGAPAAAVAAIAIALAARISGVGRDGAIAIVVTTMFGLGALLALSPASPPGIETLLFGDILGPGDGDLIAAAALAVTVVAALGALRWRLLASGFDRGAARALGLSTSAADAIVLLLLAAATVVSVQGLGSLLVVAVFVGPAAAARRLTDRVVPMIALATALALASGVAGLYVSYYAGTAAGASIALAIVAADLLAMLASRGREPRGRAATIG